MRAHMISLFTDPASTDHALRLPDGHAWHGEAKQSGRPAAESRLAQVRWLQPGLLLKTFRLRHS